jgi:hypothetical protein
VLGRGVGRSAPSVGAGRLGGFGWRAGARGRAIGFLASAHGRKGEEERWGQVEAGGGMGDRYPLGPLEG